MVIKPKYPEEDNEHLAMFEIFNRLNSGGMNLSSQEIRMSLYTSDFMLKLNDMNNNTTWRKLIGKTMPDLRLKDSELILRFFAMLMAGKTLCIKGKINYSNSLVGFLNSFANYTSLLKESELIELTDVWDKTMNILSDIKPYEFSNNPSIKNTNAKPSIPVLEALFSAIGDTILRTKYNPVKIDNVFLEKLKTTTNFLSYCTGKTTSRSNMEGRLKIASEFYNQYYGY